MSDEFEHLTNEELAAKVYLATIAPDDAVSDTVAEMYHPAVKLASALWSRLRGPYCRTDGCGLLRMDSGPWCPWHVPDSPLPDGFPPYPGHAA